MAIANVTVTLLEQDATQSIEVASITPTAVTSATDGVAIACKFDNDGNVVDGALENKNNSLQITIQSTTNSSGTATPKKAYLKAGDKYPNKILGDQEIPTAGGGEIKTFALEDISRFENADGSIKITFESGFDGNVWAIAKRAGLKPVA